MATITADDIISAQNAWTSSVILIGNTYSASYAAGSGAQQSFLSSSAVATTVLSAAYDYDNGRVLFRPTLTSTPHTFRNTTESALSYFVSGAYDTTGFATANQWKGVQFVSTNTQFWGPIAFTQGYVSFSNAASGTYGPGGAAYTAGTSSVSVDKTFGYVKDENGNVRIFLHYSALTNN
jgi:hypothetical protein